MIILSTTDNRQESNYDLTHMDSRNALCTLNLKSPILCIIDSISAVKWTFLIIFLHINRKLKLMHVICITYLSIIY